MKKLLFLMIIVGLLVFGFSGCVNPRSESPPESAPDIDPRGGGPSDSGTSKVCINDTYLNNKAYEIGEEVTVELAFTNEDVEPIEFNPWPPEARIRPRGSKERAIRGSYPGVVAVEIQPGDTIVYDLVWDQKDREGNQVPSGVYEVEFKTMARKVSAPETGQKVTSSDYIFVFHPPGAIETTIELYQTRTLYDMPLEVRGEQSLIDIMVTLEQVELSREGARFSVFATSPDWPDLDDDMPEWNFDHPQWRGPSAAYVLDGVTYSCGGVGTQYRPDGVRYVWEGDPMPADAEELTFMLTRISDYWAGPVYYYIPLPRFEETDIVADSPATPETSSIDPCRSVPYTPIEITVLGDSSYTGELLEYQLEITNTESFPVLISPFPPKISVLSPGYELVREIDQEVSELELDPGEVVTTRFTWDQKDNGGQQVPYDEHYLISTEHTVSIPSYPECKSKVRSYWDIEVEMLAMTKTIEVNQSQTVTGLSLMLGEEEVITEVTYTLEKIEMTQDYMRLYFFATSPHYGLGEDGKPAKSALDRELQRWGQYNYFRVYIDGEKLGGGVGSAGRGEEFGEEGVRFQDLTDPIPAGSNELELIILRWGDWEGPWEFRVPLE